MKVMVKIAGGEPQMRDADTVGLLKADLGLETYTAKVNGDDAADSDELSEGDFVTLAQPSKGGC